MYFQTLFPKISITDPVLSSFAGRNPPNPVLAVTSGRPELELDPFNLSLELFFRRVLLVISGIIFFPPIPDSTTGVTVEVLKLNEGTDDFALGTLLVVPFDSFSLDFGGEFTGLGRLKLYFLVAAEVSWDFVSAITDLGAEKMNDFDVKVAEEAAITLGIDPSFGELLGTTGEL